MQRALTAVVLAAAVLVAAACSRSDGSSGAVAATRLTAAELGWIREYSDLTIAIYDDDLGPPPGPELVVECRERIAYMGDPPTERLERAAELTEKVCPLLGRRGSQRRALDTIDTADDLLRTFLRDHQPLDLGAGVTEESRADTLLSEVASQAAGRPVEVRCWSESEWRQVVAEDNAWTASDDDADELYGWADDSWDRIHMRLEQCNTISRVRDEGFRDAPRRARRELADSLGTLAHETQHFVLPEADEAKVECAGMRSLATVAKRVGLDESSAQVVAELYRTDVYPELPDEYRDGGCPRKP